MINRRKRRDANHRQICEAFKKFGWSVLDTSQLGDGAPDLMVAKKNYLRVYRCNGEIIPIGPHVVAVEIKSPTGQLRAAQTKFAETWQGESVIVRGLEDVKRLSRE